MEDKNIAKFPRPVYGKIPNFVGAESEYHGILLFWCTICGKSVCRYCEPNHQIEHFLPKIR
jgi:hypothetical protein